MKTLIQILAALEKTNYFKGQLNEVGNLISHHLLRNGESFQAQISHHWWSTKIAGFAKPFDILEIQNISPFEERLSFLNEKIFEKQMLAVSEIPTVMRFVQNSTKETNNTQLVCQYLCPPLKALEQYYKLQRERKIWWMRCSANPSRYTLEPYELKESLANEHCQSLTLKSNLPHGDLAIEHITIIPLSQMPNIPENIQQLKIIDQSSGKLVLPSIIRAVVDLSTATYVMLLDSCDHERKDTLMFHRKMAPLQLAVTSISNIAANEEDLNDLCWHLRDVLERNKLRCLRDWKEIENHDKVQVDEQLSYADSLGIPYVLIVDDGSLDTGLMKLRSRDTRLAETIHISDIPVYLLKIFKNF